jgi:putative chitinase
MRPEALATAKVNSSTAGEFWKGHGLIQITGYDNHLACGIALGVDLVNQPTTLEKPVYAAESAAWFWSTRNLNELADGDFLMRITRRINGGTNGIDDRRALLITAKEASLCI